MTQKRKKEKKKSFTSKKVNVADEVRSHTTCVAQGLFCQLDYSPYCLVGGKETIN